MRYSNRSGSSLKPFDEFMAGDADVAVYRSGVGWGQSVPAAPVVLSGSFRPLHRAHRELLRVGHAIAGDVTRAACFELSIDNVEKPSLHIYEVLDRFAQFDNEGDMLILTRAATFLGKSQVLPNAAFVIGYDTVVRLFDARFYDDDGDAADDTAVAAALRAMRGRGCSFIVGGRHDADGRFMTWDDIDCPAEFRGMFTAIPSTEFCDAISSTEMRDSV